jgi:serine/threonine protein kinase
MADTAVLVTELMDTSLFAHIHKRDNYVPVLTFATMIAEQVTRGLVYIHNLELIHRDLSSNNILLDAGLRSVKIADFGLSIAQSEVTSQTAGPVS